MKEIQYVKSCGKVGASAIAITVCSIIALKLSILFLIPFQVVQASKCQRNSLPNST